MHEPTVVVTGATGFVGRALCAQLRSSGVPAARVRLLVRDASRALAAGLPRESLVVGHLREPRAVAEAVADADIVINVAGAVRALSSREYFATNADGVAVLVRAIRARAPECRLVHVSSLAAACPSVDGATSTLPPERCRPRSRYGESKRLGELAVQDVGARVSWVIVRPPIVYGPGDAATRLLFRQALAPVAPVPWIPRPLSIVHVDDLVEVVLRAATQRECTGVLAVEGPDRLDSDELMRALARACDRRTRLVRLPLPLVWPAAVLSDAVSRLRGDASFFGTDKLRDLRAPGWVADGTRVARDLGFVPRVATEAGFRAVARAEGFSPPPAG
jgi:nucleoside-diphosphate-sugar epimerase